MLGEEYDAPEIEEMVATTVVTLVSTGLPEGSDAFLTGLNAETDYDAPGAEKDRLFPKVPEADPLQRLYEPDGLAARWSEADDRAFMAGFDEGGGSGAGEDQRSDFGRGRVEVIKNTLNRARFAVGDSRSRPWYAVVGSFGLLPKGLIGFWRK